MATPRGGRRAPRPSPHPPRTSSAASPPWGQSDRGPAAPGRGVQLPWFIAVLDPSNNVISRQSFVLPAQFGANTMEVTQRLEAALDDLKPLLDRDPTGETQRIAEQALGAGGPRSEGGVLERKGMVEVISSLEANGRKIPYDIRMGVWVTVEAETDYIKNCFEEYNAHTDPSGRYFTLYKRWHLIGLEVGVSVASVANSSASSATWPSPPTVSTACCLIAKAACSSPGSTSATATPQAAVAFSGRSSARDSTT